MVLLSAMVVQDQNYHYIDVLVVDFGNVLSVLWLPSGRIKKCFWWFILQFFRADTIVLSLGLVLACRLKHRSNKWAGSCSRSEVLGEGQKVKISMGYYKTFTYMFVYQHVSIPVWVYLLHNPLKQPLKSRGQNSRKFLLKHRNKKNFNIACFVFVLV